MMERSIMIVTLAIAAAAIIAILMFVRTKHQRGSSFTPLAGLAFGCILSGLFTGNDVFIGYSLIGIGIILAVVDIVKKKNVRE